MTKRRQNRRQLLRIERRGGATGTALDTETIFDELKQ